MIEDQVIVDRVTLEWRKWVRAQAIPTEVGADLSVHLDPFFDTMLLRLQRDVLTQKITDTEHSVRMAFPATWWDHLKEKHGRALLGPWWMRRWPPQMEFRRASISIEHTVTYPEASIAKEFGKPVIVETLRGPLWTKEKP